jgi:hypothetical protein
MAEADATRGMAREAPPGWVGPARLAIGVAQGLVLYVLSEAATRAVWPATDKPLFGALVLVFAYAPLIVIGALGRIRAVPLAIWTLVAAAASAAFGWHDLDAGIWSGLASASRRLPAFPVWFFAAAFVFIGHHLVGPADEARRLVAPYPAYFDWAWKDGVQVALAAAFVGVLWLALGLGAELFKLIGIDAIAKLIEKRWFSLPVTGLAFAAAVQLTDVQVALIRGVRSVGLVLLAWLLPVMTALALAFLAALPFTGLAPLFGTRSAATTVLSAAAVLIVLASAAYEDGRSAVNVVLRWSARAAGVALVPLTLIAALALWLRIRQYGLTPARIEASLCALVAAGFAAGYAFAAARPRGPWMRPLELTNVAMARVAALIVLAVFAGVLDPARLAVDSQVGRLLAGRISPDQFDFDFLTYRAGRYGTEALARLAALKGGPRQAQIALAAQAGQAKQTPEVAPKLQVLARRLRVFPAGAQVPASFLAQDWSAMLHNSYQPCLAPDGTPCDAYVVDVDGDGVPEVLLTGETGDAGIGLEVFKRNGAGVWTDIGELNAPCAEEVAALRAGQVKVVPRTGVDVELAGHRRDVALPLTQDCAPAAPPAASPAASNAAATH